MAAELGILSLTQLRNNIIAQSSEDLPNPSLSSGAWMWNPKQAQEDDDSWEVRAFEQDTGNIMGTTWPPRSYTCTFCRREFRSAQALGGHMNVHRRDRARLHQTSTQQPAAGNTASIINANLSSPTSTLIIPTQDLSANGGLCLLYQLPHPKGILAAGPTTGLNGCCSTINDSVPSTLLSISPYPSHHHHHHHHLINPCLNISLPPASTSTSKIGEKPWISAADSTNNKRLINKADSSAAGIEEVDLELRLGPS